MILPKKDLPDLRGGLPNLDPHIKLNLADGKIVPIVIDRGSTNFSNRGEILKYNDSKEISYQGKQAWQQPVDINGTLNFITDPLANNNDITIYMNEYLRNVFFTPKQTKKEYQFVVNYLEWKTNNFKEELDIFDSTIPGFNNLSRFRNFPWVMSLLNFNHSKIYVTSTSKLSLPG